MKLDKMLIYTTVTAQSAGLPIKQRTEPIMIEKWKGQMECTSFSKFLKAVRKMTASMLDGILYCT
jgi:hypothetical protein